MKRNKWFIWTAILTVSGNVAAFDTATHAAMTAAAAGKARLGISPSFSTTVRTLGLRDYNFAFGDKYLDIGPQLVTRIGSGFEDRIIRELFNSGSSQIPDAYTLTGWLMRGAIREDDNPREVPRQNRDEPGGSFFRVFGHFHDPQNDRGLTVAGVISGPRATDWALVPGATIPSANPPINRENHFKEIKGASNCLEITPLLTHRARSSASIPDRA